MNNNSNNCGDCGTTCSECGRPWAICKQDGSCGCNKCKDIKFCEYGRMANGCIREKQPGCPMQAAIPSVTVESIEGIKNLADCLVHVSDINTTFYIDDKHRPIITWAGPIDIPGYDMEGNPNNYRDQIVTDTANQMAVIYDKSGKGYLFGLAENIDLQEQVDNKLDEMVEDGTLQEIIINYLQTKAMLVFDTVADMKLATNLVAGSYVRTLGYYSAGDDGGAIYKISDTGTSNEKNVIAVGDLYATLVYGKNINVKQFGAKGDGVQDDTSYIQAALDAVVFSGSVYFPKGYNYLVTDSLTLTQDDVCLYSEPKTEYSTRITCSTSNKTILNVTGYGATIKNLAFYGDGATDQYATVDGLMFDRSSVGDGETYSNIDCVVEDCLFFHLDSCITFKGKTVRIKNNTFTQSKKGIVGLLHKYSSETETSDFRGIYILENIFHSMNNQTNSMSGKTLETMDSFAILMPIESNKIGNIQVLNNKGEFCRSVFYKGYLPTAQINNNQWFESLSNFIYSPVEDSDLLSRSNERSCQINNNLVTGTYTASFPTNFVNIKNCANIQLTANSFRNCSGDAVVGNNTPRFVIDNNEFLQFGSTDAGNSGIKITTGACFAKENMFVGMGKGAYGITSDSDVHLKDNFYSITTKAINVDGTKIKNDNSYTSWENPTLQNGFTFDNTYNLGYRKTEDGKTELQIALQGGSDNTIAFQLPSGYRPSRGFVLTNIVLNPDQTTKAYARFYNSGDVIINWGGETPSSTTSYIINVIFD